jgi:hypothetical protein
MAVVYRPRGFTALEGEVTADADGVVTLPLTSEDSDPLGDYDVYLYDGEVIIGVGSFEIILAELNIDEAIGALEAGQPVEAALNFDRASDIYTFEGEAGAVVTVEMRSAEFDAFLTLAGADGVVLARNDNGAGGQDARITTFELPATGTYLVGATSRDAAESQGQRTVSGRYSLLLRFARFAAEGPIAPGETVIGELSTNVQTTTFTFSGTTGQTVSIDLASEDFDPLARLRAPNGREIAADDDSGPGLYANIRLALPESGEYTIVVDGNRGFTGQRVISGRFALTLNLEGAEVAAAPTATPAAAAPSGEVVGSIAYGEVQTGELTPELQQAVYTFSGTAGEVINIALDAVDFDATVVLLDAAGNELTRDDDSGPGLNALISGYTLPATGEYRIVVDGYRGVQGDRQLLGAYTLTLSSGADIAQGATPTAIPGATQAPTSAPQPGAPTPTALPSLPPSEPGRIAVGEVIAGELTADLQTASYTFTGTAGEAVTIALTANGFDPFLRLLDASGAELTTDDDGGGGLNARISNFILPASGDYTIVVDAYRGPAGDRPASGTFSLTLNVSAPGTVMATPTLSAEVATATPQPGTVTQPPPVETTPTATPAGPLTAPTSTPVAPVATLRPGAIPTPAALGFDGVLTATFTGAPDEAITFRFGAVAGDVVTISASSGGQIDTSMTLIGPNGEALASDDDGGESFDPELRALKLPDTGEYVIVLTPFNPGDRGTVEISLKLLSPAMLDAGSQIIQINAKNPTQSFLFYGNEGETIRLTVRSISQVVGTPEFVVTQGDRLLASNPVGQNMRLAFDFVVQDDGPVIVTVTGGEAGSAVLEVNIERLP